MSSYALKYNYFVFRNTPQTVAFSEKYILGLSSTKLFIFFWLQVLHLYDANYKKNIRY